MNPVTPLWCDARSHRILARPRMWFQTSEAFIQVIFELLEVRAHLVGEKDGKIDNADYRRLGLQDGRRYVLPETIDDDFVQKIREFAIEKGYDPRDFDKRDQDVLDHIEVCPECRSRMKGKVESCAERQRLDSFQSGSVGQ